MTKDQEYTHARAIGAEIFGSANEAEFWRLRAEIADLEAQNADLLDALKALQAGFADGSIRFTRTRQSDTDPYHPANILVCAAIAKAEGE